MLLAPKPVPHPIPDGWTDYGLEDAAWGPKLSAYALGVQEQREAFLIRLAEIGEPALLEAVSHIWSLLLSPKTTKCAAMAVSAGVSGAGKVALWNVLASFIAEYVSVEFMMPPEPGRGPHATHAAFTAMWADEANRERAVLARYSDILNGVATRGGVAA